MPSTGKKETWCTNSHPQFCGDFAKFVSSPQSHGVPLHSQCQVSILGPDAHPKHPLEEAYREWVKYSIPGHQWLAPCSDFSSCKEICIIPQIPPTPFLWEHLIKMDCRMRDCSTKSIPVCNLMCGFNKTSGYAHWAYLKILGDSDPNVLVVSVNHFSVNAKNSSSVQVRYRQ